MSKKPPTVAENRTTQTPPPAAHDTPTPGHAEDEALRRRIAEAAYYRAQRRGFAPGGEQQDWFEAESDLRAPTRRNE